MLETLLRVAQCDLNNPFSWISPVIIKLFYGPHDTFIPSVSALYPVREGGDGFLYYMLCSFPCYCSVPFLRHQNTAAAEASRGPPLTQTLNAVWYQQSSAEDNRKPNTARIMLYTQTQAKSANTLPCSCFDTSSPHDTTVNAALRYVTGLRLILQFGMCGSRVTPWPRSPRIRSCGRYLGPAFFQEKKCNLAFMSLQSCTKTREIALPSSRAARAAGACAAPLFVCLSVSSSHSFSKARPWFSPLSTYIFQC